MCSEWSHGNVCCEPYVHSLCSTTSEHAALEQLFPIFLIAAKELSTDESPSWLRSGENANSHPSLTSPSSWHQISGGFLERTSGETEQILEPVILILRASALRGPGPGKGLLWGPLCCHRHHIGPLAGGTMQAGGLRACYWMLPHCRCCTLLGSMDCWELGLGPWDNEQSQQHFRMARGTFVDLCAKLAPLFQHQTIGLWHPMFTKKCGALVIWKLSNTDSLCFIANQFIIEWAMVTTAMHNHIQGDAALARPAQGPAEGHYYASLLGGPGI